MAAGAARGLTVEVGAAGGTAVRAATAEAPSEARSMWECAPWLFDELLISPDPQSRPWAKLDKNGLPARKNNAAKPREGWEDGNLHFLTSCNSLSSEVLEVDRVETGHEELHTLTEK
jgi:hypothetical protein